MGRRRSQDIALPTFLGIGVPRAGTTWLYELLGEHSAVFVPSRRKEIFFFDKHYERGLGWYQKFFPPAASEYQAVGEITPFYLYGSACPDRIAQFGVEKLILMLRNPVERAWSYYAHMVHDGAFWGSFEDFLLRTKLGAIEHGYYAKYLRRYLERFRREQILVLIYEEAMNDISDTKLKIARFLEIAPGGFPPNAGAKRVNASFLPKARRAYSLAFGLSQAFRRLDLDFLVNTAKRLGVKDMFGTGGKISPMTSETSRRLSRLFEADINETEQLLARPLDLWR